MTPQYCPDRGDIVWLDFVPHLGHEQGGRRPALILSPKVYNQKVGLAVGCPITGKSKGYPFEVALPAIAMTKGVVLADQVRNMDWRVRRAEPIESIPEDFLAQVVSRINALIQPSGFNL